MHGENKENNEAPPLHWRFKVARAHKVVDTPRGENSFARVAITGTKRSTKTP